jgi:hypothetical protein
MRIVRLFALALLPLLAPPAARATSYVPVSDAALVDQAALIAVVQVQDSGPGAQGERPSTSYRVRVEKTLKGTMASGFEIRVRVPGGADSNGLGLRIWGAPSFARGERALLFLSPRLDGSYDILHLMLGAFHEVRAGGGRRFAVRHLAEARPVALPGEPLPQEPLRDFERFASWVGSRARDLRARADYQVAPAEASGLRQIADGFTLSKAGDGIELRWFFDLGTVPYAEWFAHQDGQQGLAGGGFAEFQAALAAWTNNPSTSISYLYGGTTTDTTGLTSYDTVNTILFNDPNGEVSPYVCGSGGVLALGAPWYEEATTSYQGKPYHRIVNADIVTNNGIACFFSASPNASKAAEEIFGHELGHTLGLGSSSVPQALMNPAVHDDGRGAALHNDDRAGAAALYSAPPLTYDYPQDFFAIAPCRLVDTRNASGPFGGPTLQAGFQRTFSVPNGACGVSSAAVAISVNITVVNPTGNGYFRVFPPERQEPNTSTLNFSQGQTRANNAILPLSLNLFHGFTVAPFMDGGTADLVIDVNGFFADCTPATCGV